MEKDSPAYVPSLFSFTDPSTKRRAEQALARWQVTKRRCMDDEPEAIEISETEATELTLEDIDSTVITDSKRSIACQTDLT